MKPFRLTRRETLLKCASTGVLKVVPWLGLATAVETVAAQERAASHKETQWNEIGPFYKRLAPNTANLRAPGDPGMPLTVSGTVFNTRGDVVPDAKIEIWHADHHGFYDIDGYRFRAMLIAGRDGRYSFDSIMPGHYPDRVCQHIHYLVTSPGYQPLITQLYFATDPVFEGDPDRNYQRDPLVISRELVRPVTLNGDPETIQAKVKFELVMEQQ